MSGFFRGFLCGIGIGFIIAPMRGQEMRHLVGERVQTLRQSLPNTERIQPYQQQISDRTTQDTNTFKDVSAQASTQVKEKTSTSGNTMPQARSRSEQTDRDIVEATEVPSTQMQEGVQMPPVAPMTSSHDTNSNSKVFASNDLLSALPGMEPEVQHELEEQGIGTISQLLEQTMTKESRTDLAHKTTISIHHLKTLVDRADLMRIHGIGGDRATLLEEAGVSGCKDLQHRNPEHLYATLTDWYKSGMAASPIPTLDQVTQWIAEAKTVTAIAQRKQ